MILPNICGQTFIADATAENTELRSLGLLIAGNFMLYVLLSCVTATSSPRNVPSLANNVSAFGDAVNNSYKQK